ncbi:tRNA/rRNA methyltransferase [Plesiomonas shigelloides]|uniref:tRNA/rRNA methyltransferase n=1 Tax=Plesiomonas shigelloides TaxID=703 RepID=UPI0012619CA8|nr:tRNA/rRNA methyltransferase [Plesiomonas shigelloides]KAB7667076.1 tRNA/rRNA methyltransferase [Plesiomonas shigelloides]
MTDDRKPRFNRDNNSYDNPYGNRGGNESRRDDRPRFERDGERKPRFNDERRSEGRNEGRRDDRPRFERDGEQKPRFNDNRRSEGRGEGRRDDRPRFERDGERKPRFNDDRRSEGRGEGRRDDRPRFERDGERKPRFNDDRRSEGRGEGRRDDRPRFERDGERKPRFNDDRRSEGRGEGRRDDRPRFERDGERKPRFNDDRRSEGRGEGRRDDRPRFERDGERKPRFNDDRRSEGRGEGRRDDRPRFERDGERKPRFNDERRSEGRGEGRRDDRPRQDKRSHDRRSDRRSDAPRGNAEKQRFDRVQDEQGNVTFVAHTPVERESAYVGGEQTLSLKRNARAAERVEVESDEPEALHNGIDMDQIRRQRAEETRIYGENACQLLFANRPDVIVRGWFTPQVTPRFSDTLRWMAANRKAYHVVDAEEMAKVAGSEHHGGVCLLIKKRRPLHLLDYLDTARDSDCLLALENVANPHNLGGIMRSCAHFGVRGVVMRQAGNLESGAAVRTAEGGAEFLQPIAVEDFAAGLERLRQAGYTIVTTSSHAGQSVFSTKLPAKVVIVFGEEKGGISDDTLQQGDLALSIPGTGHVESLNVSVATGILLGEWWRQHGVQA